MPNAMPLYTPEQRRRRDASRWTLVQGVLALHTAWLVAWAGGWLGSRDRMLLALAAYAAYVVNATQFLLKLRAARLQAPQQVPA